MKRISAVLVALAMLAMCTSSFGYFVIYNLSTTVKGADDATDLKVTIPMKGYLVLNLSDTNDSLVDANLILYGKDNNTPAKQKVYVQINKSNTGSNRLDITKSSIGDLLFIDMFTGGNFLFEMLMSGKMTLKDIGKGVANKELVATSIKGINMVWDGFLLGPPGQDIRGTANASASLWTALTKTVNKDGWTQEQIVETGKDTVGGHQNSLIERLVAQHYHAAELPLP